MLLMQPSTQSTYSDKRVPLPHGYPEAYSGPQPIEKQIEVISRIFDLDPTYALSYAENLPPLNSFVPADGQEGYFAILNEQSLEFVARHNLGDQGFDDRYCQTLKLIFTKITDSRLFGTWKKNRIDKNHIKVSSRTQEMMRETSEGQKGSILIIAAQTGKRWGGYCTGFARDSFDENEFGLTSVAVGSILLANPKRINQWKELEITCGGDDFSHNGDVLIHSNCTPCFRFDNHIKFGTIDISYIMGWYGVASGFVF